MTHQVNEKISMRVRGRMTRTGSRACLCRSLGDFRASDFTAWGEAAQDGRHDLEQKGHTDPWRALAFTPSGLQEAGTEQPFL